MLLSASVTLPKTIFVHGYLTIEGKKISKSLGNVIDPVALADKYGTDTLRYYLLRRFPTADDGDFTIDRLIRTHNSDLADQLGNLLSRTEGMIGRYYDGVVPAPALQEAPDLDLIRKAEQVPEKVRSAIESFAVHDAAAAAVWELIAEANRYVVAVEPWALAKRRAHLAIEARLATCLYNLVEVLRLVSGWAEPFIPSSAAAIAKRVGVGAPAEGFAQVEWGRYPSGTKLPDGGSLFPKFEPGG